MKKISQFTTLISLLILILSACSPVASAYGIPTLAPPTTPQPALTQIPGTEAQVQSVEIQMSKTDPIQINAVVRGQFDRGLSNIR